MDSLSNQDIDAQYLQLQQHLKSAHTKLRKYRDYSSQLQAQITQRIRAGSAKPDSFPSLAIEVKPVEKAPLKESLVADFFTSIFAQTSIRDAIMEQFRTFRRESSIGTPPTISIKLRHQ